MTSDAKGNVQQQFAWNRSSIIDYLKQAGLDDALAEDLSKQFLDANGKVGYAASDAQKRWGGKYSTLAEALGKMAEYYKYDDSGKHEAAQRTAFLRGNQGGMPAPAPSPAPQSPSMFGQQSVTVNLQLNGQGYGHVNTDSDGSRVIQGLLSELERAKRNTGR